MASDYSLQIDIISMDIFQASQFRPAWDIEQKAALIRVNPVNPQAGGQLGTQHPKMDRVQWTKMRW